jgi:hypothetical protein
VETKSQMCGTSIFNMRRFFCGGVVFRLKLCVFLAAVLTAAARPAESFAALGDNELKISRAYGEPAAEQKLSPSLTERRYRAEGLEIAVVFLNGTSQCEIFKKSGGSPLTDGQIGKILEANGNRLVWTPDAPPDKNPRAWVIAGPKPAAPELSREPAVLAVSARPAGAGGEKLVAVDMLETGDSAPAPAAPSVLRRAFYFQGTTNASLKIFTAAYEAVAGRELPHQKQKPAQDR